MPDLHRIEALPRLGGRTVVVRGWVMTTRSSGKIAFVMLRDGTGYLQVVLSKKDLPDAVWEAFGQLTQETSVEVTGVVRADTRAPGGVELTAADLKILGPSHDFPITPKEHGTAFLFEHRHLWLRSRRQVAIARVRSGATGLSWPIWSATRPRSSACGRRFPGFPTPTPWKSSKAWGATSYGAATWAGTPRRCSPSSTTAPCWSTTIPRP